MEHDPVEAAIREVERLSSESGKTRPVEPDPVVGLAEEILQPKPEIQTEIVPMGTLNRDLAIRLRWSLRDIDRKRTKLSPVSPDDLNRLVELGLVTIEDDGPVLTKDGYRAIR
jgi:hypothetical protein